MAYIKRDASKCLGYNIEICPVLPSSCQIKANTEDIHEIGSSFRAAGVSQNISEGMSSSQLVRLACVKTAARRTSIDSGVSSVETTAGTKSLLGGLGTKNRRRSTQLPQVMLRRCPSNDVDEGPHSLIDKSTAPSQ